LLVDLIEVVKWWASYQKSNIKYKIQPAGAQAQGHRRIFTLTSK